MVRRSVFLNTRRAWGGRGGVQDVSDGSPSHHAQIICTKGRENSMGDIFTGRCVLTETKRFVKEVS